VHDTVTQSVVDGVQSLVVVHCWGGGSSWQMPPVQMALWQSLFVEQTSPSGQLGHEPPQSMSVSFWSFLPSVQLGTPASTATGPVSGIGATNESTPVSMPPSTPDPLDEEELQPERTRSPRNSAERPPRARRIARG
jgi:hypothetical protein